MDWLNRQSRTTQIAIGCGCLFVVVSVLISLLVLFLLSPFFSFGP